MLPFCPKIGTGIQYMVLSKLTSLNSFQKEYLYSNPEELGDKDIHIFTRSYGNPDCARILLDRSWVLRRRTLGLQVFFNFMLRKRRRRCSFQCRQESQSGRCATSPRVQRLRFGHEKRFAKLPKQAIGALHLRRCTPQPPF